MGIPNSLTRGIHYLELKPLSLENLNCILLTINCYQLPNSNLHFFVIKKGLEPLGGLNRQPHLFP